jgi:hypothetical protein
MKKKGQKQLRKEGHERRDKAGKINIYVKD